MKPFSSSVLFAIMLAFSLTLIVWWSYFHHRQYRELRSASELLVVGRIDAAAQALGAADASALSQLATNRQVMLMSESTVFAVILILGGVLFFASLRREQEIYRNQDRFLAGATHELKTPLATIRLGLESLQNPRLPDEKRGHYLRAMVAEADRLERGLSNLLTAAGLRATGRQLHPLPGDLADDVRQAMDTLRERGEAAGVELDASQLDSAIVERDPEAMQRILTNLLDNAIKYSETGGHVDVMLESAGDEAVLRVTDRGRGMTAEELRKAFAPFYRGRASQAGGAGLGLHLVRELVSAHGGTVEAHSQGPGEGSEFRLRFPLRGAKP